MQNKKNGLEGLTYCELVRPEVESLQGAQGLESDQQSEALKLMIIIKSEYAERL